MGDGKGFDSPVSDGECLPRMYSLAIGWHHLAVQPVSRAQRHMKRDVLTRFSVQASVQDGCCADVIGVLMRNEHSINGGPLQAHRGHSGVDLLGGETAVNEQALVTISDVRRVSAATRTEHGNGDVVVKQCAHVGESLSLEGGGESGRDALVRGVTVARQRGQSMRFPTADREDRHEATRRNLHRRW